jgi:hypothetical protein
MVLEGTTSDIEDKRPKDSMLMVLERTIPNGEDKRLDCKEIHLIGS